MYISMAVYKCHGMHRVWNVIELIIELGCGGHY